MIDKWTVVQHSGFGYNGDPTFARGLESRRVTTKAESTRVERVGGLLFDSYGKAEDFCDTAAYPEGYVGLTPCARASFADATVDGLRIYVPVREVVG